MRFPSHSRWFRMALHLRIDRSRGPAPHKPLLLLVLTQLAAEGLLPPGDLPLTPELAFRFLSFWGIVAHRRPQKPEIRLPFFHLHSDGCWTPLDARGEPTTDRRVVLAARLDPGFRDCLLNPLARAELQRILVATYFEPGEGAALCDLLDMKTPRSDEVRETASEYEVARQGGREARFRLTVVPAYNYTCALTGYRLTTIDAGSLVEAAHIHEFASSRNNDPCNGIALSRNAHWAFDEGLWSLTDTCHVLVASDRFTEAGPDAFLLTSMAGSQIHLPQDPSLRPDARHLAWHRKEHQFTA